MDDERRAWYAGASVPSQDGPSAQETVDVQEIPDVAEELKQEAITWLRTVMFAIVVAWLVINFVIVNARVPSGSMENTIRTDDRVVAFRLSYLFREPQTFDVVVFRGSDDPATLYVKRVIGMPGDEVLIVDGRVYINGSTEPLRDDFVRGELFGNFGPYVVPIGHVFVLGDNRGNSRDSRHWNNTFVNHCQILGRVIFRYLPDFSILINS